MRDFIEKTEALGYMIMAAKQLDIDPTVIKALVKNTQQNMGTWTEQAAEAEYDNFLRKEM